ncbi:TetR/AcrR family transcriptional regulator [Pseudonocardia endophytica]|nr:TetR/AcrR family transcriptional regulator [Pseudonocardia endophytica]
MTRRRPATVVSLLDAAERLFAEQGVRGTSIAQLCDAAGFTRGAFYSNFATKEEVLYLLYERRHETLVAVVDEGLGALGAVDDPVGEVVRRVMDFGGDAYQQWFLVTSEFTALGARDESAALRLAAARERTRELVARVMAATFDAAGREPVTPLTILAWSVMSWFLGWQAQRLGEPDATRAVQDERAAAALRELLLGASRPAGNGGAACG